MNCPVCGERMRETQRNGVSMEICPACKGVWLEKGRFDALLGSAPSPQTTPSVAPHDAYRRHDSDSDDDYRYGKHGHSSKRHGHRKGFLRRLFGELFD